MSLNAIGIISKDVQASIQFYNLLGLRFEASSEDHYEAITESGLRIMLDSEELIKKINPRWKKVINRQISLCFKQESPLEVSQLYDSLIKAGYQSIKEPWDAFWGQKYALVADPDGNQIDIFADL